MCPSTWKFDFTNPSLTTDYTSPSQSSQAALMVAELVPTAKMFKKYFFLFRQVSKKYFQVMKKKHKIFLIKI